MLRLCLLMLALLSASSGVRAVTYGRCNVSTISALGQTNLVTPVLTQGPYFVDEKINSSDIRFSQAGVALTLSFHVLNVSDPNCAPLTGAVVDLWHANPYGKYSDITSEGTIGQTWLRGSLTVPASGVVTFITVYPGQWRS
jgi:protocatechuate 3,4-dioxygenase beta subunit